MRFGWNGLSGFEQRREVQQIIIHPDFNSATSDSDIALLKMTSPVALGDNVDIVALPELDDGSVEYPEGTRFRLAGYSSTLQDPITPILTRSLQSSCLRCSDEATVSGTKCNILLESDGSTNLVATQNTICTGAVGSGSCGAGAGSTLITANSNGRSYIVGITFMRSNCGNPIGSLHTRVDKFLAFIRGNMN